MKILFAGPSLYGRIREGRVDDDPGIACRGPARHGDLARAVLDGATAIGLVDGRYEDVAAVWHKEILFALAKRVHVLGAASMGALRAAECAPFGMIGIGAVFARYASNALTDDAAVAQLHGPAELGYLPLTEALVNVEATLDHLAEIGALSGAPIAGLRDRARALFFKDRTYPAIVAGAGFAGAEADRMLALIEAHRVDVKQHDAGLLVEHLRQLPAGAGDRDRPWQLAETGTWRGTLRDLSAASP